MKVGLIPVNVGVSRVEQMVSVAQKAEEVGVESLWTFEHVIVPVDYASKYPYSPNGKMGSPPETNFVDPLIALTAIAAHTRTVRLGTGVNILPQTNPLYLAKQVASLDFASNGRFMVGLGTRLAARGVRCPRRALRTPRRALRRLRGGDEEGLVRRGRRARERVPQLVGLQELPGPRTEGRTFR